MCQSLRSAFPLLLLAGLAACGDAIAPATITLASVTPAPASTNVAPGAALSFTFSHAMANGMEQYVDLHQGDARGPVVPMDCGWSPDSRVLTCMPTDPLARGARYTMHVGGGMLDAQGHPASLGDWAGHGGTWMDSGMMGGGMGGGGMHDGQSLNLMPAGWHHGPDHYGMTFEFTTAP